MTTSLINKYGMDNAKTKTTPISTATKLTKQGEPLDTSTYGYSELIGSLLYLSVCTRPDIAQAVGALATYIHVQAPATYIHVQADYGSLDHCQRSSQ
eukprot:106562-Pelagomonas_calceolata.AAC.1